MTKVDKFKDPTPVLTTFLGQWVRVQWWQIQWRQHVFLDEAGVIYWRNTINWQATDPFRRAREEELIRAWEAIRRRSQEQMNRRVWITPYGVSRRLTKREKIYKWFIHFFLVLSKIFLRTVLIFIIIPIFLFDYIFKTNIYRSMDSFIDSIWDDG